MQLKDNYHKEELKSIVGRLKDLLEDESGFLFIYTGKDNKISDVYHNVCSDCVSEVVNVALSDAVRNNLLKGGKMAKETKIKDIFDGEFLTAWEDEGMFYLSTPYVTLNFIKEDWEVFKEEMRKLVDL